jgi:hypothetical protein
MANELLSLYVHLLALACQNATISLRAQKGLKPCQN